MDKDEIVDKMELEDEDARKENNYGNKFTFFRKF